MESVTAMNMVSSLGGSPTPISWGELYTALQQGVVDGAENNPPSFYLSRHYEVCKFYSLDEHTTVPDVLIMGTHLWKSLSTQEQKWVQASATASVDYQRILWAEAEKEALEEVQKAGVKVIRPDKTLFQAKVHSMYEDYKDVNDVYSFIQRIQAVK
jgi:TRAP-type C4-dicarboxylate transport system substrate-binding protein